MTWQMKKNEVKSRVTTEVRSEVKSGVKSEVKVRKNGYAHALLPCKQGGRIQKTHIKP